VNTASEFDIAHDSLRESIDQRLFPQHVTEFLNAFVYNFCKFTDNVFQSQTFEAHERQYSPMPWQLYMYVLRILSMHTSPCRFK
jgi:hypothetical protein